MAGYISPKYTKLVGIGGLHIPKLRPYARVALRVPSRGISFAKELPELRPLDVTPAALTKSKLHRLHSNIGNGSPNYLTMLVFVLYYV